MLSEFRKSINAVLHERIASPFSGAFFFSWIVWNWKLIYYLLFSNQPVIDRIEFVQLNYINIWNGLLYPLFSTIFLVVLFPFITTGAYWVWLNFKRWQKNIRDKIEMTQLLSIEKSIELRKQMRNQQDDFDRILGKKDEEFLLLKKQLEDCLKSNGGEPSNNQDNTIVRDYSKEFNEFKNSQYYNYFNLIIETIISRGVLSDRKGIPPIVLGYYESNDIISPDNNRIYHSFTPKGTAFMKYHLEKKVDS